MKKITIRRANGDRTSITAPDGKDMTVDQGLLQHGVLQVGEYGPSGIKIATFNDWDEAWYDADAAGYVIAEENPF